ncbi:MAG: cytochrome c oxidase assembly protein [Humibacillus sp.]|nr:cytochrome c oxidase assembly protein [Humibacillus sp.]MDN5778252.1 cytochrome c oxidase assembly protein [Humibacillus sp.]
MRDFTPLSLLTAWTASPSGILAVVVATGVYARWLLLARARGIRWSGWRVGLYAGLGVGTLAYAVCGPLAVYRDHIFWVGALQVGMLASLTPVGLALGDPVRLLRRLHPDGRHWALRLLATPVPRVLMFPAVGTALAVGIIIAVFFTPWFQATTESNPARWLLDIVLLTSGLLFVLPLMVDELLPSWATPGVRTLLAFIDGLADAIPGILVMTSSVLLTPHFPGWTGASVSGLDPMLDQRLGGGALLVVAESVGLPVIGAVFMEWVRSDAAEAEAFDAAQDAAITAALTPNTTAPDSTGSGSTGSNSAGSNSAGSTGEPDASAAPTAPAAPADTGLWWTSDPRFARRHTRGE